MHQIETKFWQVYGAMTARNEVRQWHSELWEVVRNNQRSCPSSVRLIPAT